MRATKITTTEHFDKCLLAELQSKVEGQAAGNAQSYFLERLAWGYCLPSAVSFDRSGQL